MKGLTTLTNENNGCSGFLGLLTILFIALKLTNVIAWSWWWVLSPLWIPIIIVLVIAIVVFLIKLVADMLL